jgi:hypothetical protein
MSADPQVIGQGGSDIRPTGQLFGGADVTGKAGSFRLMFPFRSGFQAHGWNDEIMGK